MADLVRFLSVKGALVPRCPRVAETRDVQCLLRAGHEANASSPHCYTGCPECDVTYDPCSRCEPSAHAAWEAERKRRLAARRSAEATLSDRRAELPDWARSAVDVLFPQPSEPV